MALGGGKWLFQNKVLPGSYINFVSKDRATVEFADRGFAAMALELDWGPVGEVFAVESGDFQKSTTAIFGYDYTHEKITGLRDLFKNLKTGYFYRLNNGAVKASCAAATAKYAGVRGNDIKLVIANNIDETSLFDVTTYLEGVVVDKQTVASMTDLNSNDFVVFDKAYSIAATAGMPLTGGDNGGAVTGLQYQEFLEKIEPYYFNILGCQSTQSTIQDLYIQFTKRMRDDVGAKFQTVVWNKENVDYEGVISIKNRVTDDGVLPASLVYWVTGAEASCAVNRSVTNKTYDGDFTVDVNYKQSELEKAIRAGMLVFHRVTDSVGGDIVGDVNVLDDINTFTSFTKEKNQDFSDNQVIRVLDQIAIDIARLFNKQYIGKVPNDADGRMSLWKDIVFHHQTLEGIRAIQNFVPEDVTVEKGNDKGSVIVVDPVEPTSCMKKLYMTVIVA